MQDYCVVPWSEFILYLALQLHSSHFVTLDIKKWPAAITDNIVNVKC